MGLCAVGEDYILRSNNNNPKAWNLNVPLGNNKSKLRDAVGRQRVTYIWSSVGGAFGNYKIRDNW